MTAQRSQIFIKTVPLFILGENATQLEQMNYQNLQNAPGGQYAQHSPGSAPRGGPQPYGAPPGKQVSVEPSKLQDLFE